MGQCSTFTLTLPCVLGTSTDAVAQNWGLGAVVRRLLQVPKSAANTVLQRSASTCRDDSKRSGALLRAIDKPSLAKPEAPRLAPEGPQCPRYQSYGSMRCIHDECPQGCRYREFRPRQRRTATLESRHSCTETELPFRVEMTPSKAQGDWQSAKFPATQAFADRPNQRHDEVELGSVASRH